MKKNLKVIQINGFRGLLLALFIISCLIAGFVAFPSLVGMSIWNYLSEKTNSFPLINFGQGLLLWGMIVLSAFILNKRKFIISFDSKQELSDEEMKNIMSKIKTQKMNLPSDNISDKNLNDELEVHSKNDN